MDPHSEPQPDRAESIDQPDRTPAGVWLSAAAATGPLAVAGGLVGLLLLYLNPEAEIAGMPMVRLVATECLVGVAVGLLVVLPFLWRNLPRSAATFPWAMTLVLVAGAGLYLMHASRWSYYLPAIANRRLLYAAAVMFSLALPAFYTALLHTVHQRPYSYRSIGLVVASGISALLVLTLIRPAQAPAVDPPATRPPAIVEPVPIFVVGVDGASLEVLLPMAERGSLPTLGGWIREGVVASVTPLDPPRPSALWASAATGTWPFHHHIQGSWIYHPPWNRAIAMRLLPEGLGFEHWGLLGQPGAPIAASDLARKPLWEVYRDLGLTAEVRGWPPTGGPALAAVEVAGLAAGADATLFRIGDLKSVSERNLGAWLRTRRGDRDDELEAAARQLENAYQAVDRALAAWQATLPADRVVAVVSPHGYGPLPGWRELLNALSGVGAGRGTARGGQPGVLILHGPAIRSGERLPAVRVVDLMPTLAHAAGLPVAADLDGDVITRAFSPEGLADRPLTFVPSYESWGRVD